MRLVAWLKVFDNFLLYTLYILPINKFLISICSAYRDVNFIYIKKYRYNQQSQLCLETLCSIIIWNARLTIFSFIFYSSSHLQIRHRYSIITLWCFIITRPNKKRMWEKVITKKESLSVRFSHIHMVTLKHQCVLSSLQSICFFFLIFPIFCNLSLHYINRLLLYIIPYFGDHMAKRA